MRKAISRTQHLIQVVCFIVLCAFGLLLLVSFVGSCIIKQNNPPSITEAPWSVQTSSRFYYAKEYLVIDGVPTIRNYWTFDGQHYHFVQGTMPFPKREYGQVAIIRRTK